VGRCSVNLPAFEGAVTFLNKKITINTTQMKTCISYTQRLVSQFRFQFLFLIFPFVPFSSAQAHSIKPGIYAESPLEGRWDLTLSNSGKTYPSWLEVRHSGLRTLVGQFVGQGGSARPISRINFTDHIVSFSIPPQWDTASNDLVFEGRYEGDSLKGTIIMPDGTLFKFTGLRAPLLRNTSEPAWASQVKLFDGKDLKGWHVSGEKNQWLAKDGMMTSPASGSNIMTDAVFNDFKLHIEFRIPAGSNSGVYLRGRYEIQIVDSKGQEPNVGLLGAIYGFISPMEMMANAAGEWQSFDVTLIGRLVTLAVNGKVVISKQEIPGITGGAINSKEGEPGPIMIQGDHGPIDLRNILITTAK
jgi:hypothetical protein